MHPFFIQMAKDSVIKATELVGSPGRTTILPDNKSTSYIGGSNLDWYELGSDNLWPQAIAFLNRKAAIHRGILNNKATFISGRGFVCDDKQKDLIDIILSCNANDDNLRKPVKRAIFDELSFGNSYFELVTDSGRSYLNFYHTDATKCRVGRNKYEGKIVLHPNWAQVNNSKEKLRAIPAYPEFDDVDGDGILRSMVHIKDFENEFVTYGVSSCIAGLGAGSICYKTDTWNLSRLDNGFKYSGILLLDAVFKDEEEEEKFDEELKAAHSGEGKQGQVLKVKKPMASDGTKFIPFDQTTDADWIKMNDQSVGTLIVAHQWFRTLAGIVDNTGFDTQRILNEYQVALSTVILDKQTEYLNILKTVIQNELGIDASSLNFINRPPVIEKPAYMKVWEARKADGLEYDEKDPTQNIYLAEMGRAKAISLI